MINFITGKLKEKSDEMAVIQSGGLGFEVAISMATSRNMPALEEEVFLHTHFQMREDGVRLFGFSSREEKELFLTLLDVKSIGGKTALDILSAVKPDRFASAIVEEDVTFLTTIKGIGKKTAERLVFELKEKIHRLSGSSAKPSVGAPKGTTAEDAVMGLVFLGTQLALAQKAVTLAAEELGTDASVEDLIKTALKFR